MNLSEALQSVTGISDPLVLDVITGVLFVTGVLIIVSTLIKSLTRYI